MNMKLLFALCSALLAGCAHRLVALDIADSWFECDRHRQCAILEDPRCQLIPINRRYADAFAAWVRRNRAAQIREEPCSQNDSRYFPSCDAGRCTSNLIRAHRNTRDDASR